MPWRVTSGEFVRDVGYWLNEALLQPVDITHHGKVKLRLSVPDADDESEQDAENPDIAPS